MTEEEYFRKNYPNSCYGDKPLSPHWDFFQDGVEFGERQSEKRIEELEQNVDYYAKRAKSAESHIIRQNERIAHLEKEIAELKEQNKKLLESCEGATMMYKDLCKAKEIIKELIDFDFLPDVEITRQAEQFLSEVKK